MRLVLAATLALVCIGPASAQLQPTNEAGMTMGHVHLNVTDMEAQRKFWTEMFDAVPLKREGLQGVKVPGMLILFRNQKPTDGTAGGAIDHFGFLVRDLDGMLKRAADGGYMTLPVFKGSEGVPNSYVIGPDGVKVELQTQSDQTQWAVAQHLHYMVKDPDALRTWYLTTFSMDGKMRGNHRSANLPGMNLSLDPLRRVPVSYPIKGRAMDHIGFEVKNLEAFCKKLEAQGIKFDSPYRKIPERGLAVAFLTDPEGAYIELTEGLDQY
jgi:catechol 2,3-dioxygenase-like lactoylglutathione lyase family enzyme